MTFLEIFDKSGDRLMNLTLVSPPKNLYINHAIANKIVENFYDQNDHRRSVYQSSSNAWS